MKGQIEAIYNSLTPSEDLPEKEPNKRLITPLFKHQRQALYFLVERERKLLEIPSVNLKTKDKFMTAETMTLWRRDQSGRIVNLITNEIWTKGTVVDAGDIDYSATRNQNEPLLARGGILADGSSFLI